MFISFFLLLCLVFLVGFRVYLSFFMAPPMGGSMTIGSREVQEDFYFHGEKNGVQLLVVADGNGETYAGRIASQSAVKTFRDLFQTYNKYENPKYFFKKAFHAANRSILHELDNGQKGSTSLAVAMIDGDTLYYSSVGNVKLFLFRKGDLVQITCGHTLETLAKREFSQGKITRSEALAMLEDSRLYNYLGQEDFRELELFDEGISLQEKDIVLVATDGVYDLLTIREIEETLTQKKSMQKIAFELVEKINNSPQEDKDNGAVVLYKIGEVL